MFLSKNMEVKLPLVLGSSSVFRCGQLRRLGIDFQTASPDFDETPIAGEHAGETALRLAEGKARSLAATFSSRAGFLARPENLERSWVSFYALAPGMRNYKLVQYREYKDFEGLLPEGIIRRGVRKVYYKISKMFPRKNLPVQF